MLYREIQITYFNLIIIKIYLYKYSIFLYKILYNIKMFIYFFVIYKFISPKYMNFFFKKMNISLS